MTAVRCDFCYSDQPTWRYPCKSFGVAVVVGKLTAESLNDWAACDPCHLIIQGGDVDALIARVAAESPIVRALPRDRKRRMERNLHTMYRQFFAHRTGTAMPI